MTSDRDNSTTKTKQGKEKSPAFQFYPKDVLSDGNAMAMPAEAFGIYIRLLCFDWIDNGIINDDKVWAKLGGFEYFTFDGDTRNLRDWEIILSYLTPQFIPHPTKENYVTNPRLLKERAIQESRSQSAKESADKRWHPEGCDSTHMRTQCERNANAMRRQCFSSSSSSSSSKNIDIDIEATLPAPTNPPPKKVKKEIKPLEWPPELDTPQVREAFAEWQAHRRGCWAPMSRGYEQAILDAYKANPSDIIPAIKNSIKNGWKKLVHPRENFAPLTPGKKETNVDRAKRLFKETEINEQQRDKTAISDSSECLPIVRTD